MFVIYREDHKSLSQGCRTYHPGEEMRLSYSIAAIITMIFVQSTLWGLLLYALKNSSLSYKKRLHHRVRTLLNLPKLLNPKEIF